MIFFFCRALVLCGSQAEETVTVPTCAGDRLSDLGKAAEGTTVPGEPIVEHHHPFEFAFPLADEQGPRIEGSPVPCHRAARLERIAGEIDRLALRSANDARSRLVEVP